MATGEAVPVAILRDASLRDAPQDEVCGDQLYPPDRITFMESIL
jgi:hypothetical protein